MLCLLLRFNSESSFGRFCAILIWLGQRRSVVGPHILGDRGAPDA
jgi:hypothetical protein